METTEAVDDTTTEISDDLSDLPFSVVKEIIQLLKEEDSPEVEMSTRELMILEIAIMWDRWLLRREKGKRTKKDWEFLREKLSSQSTRKLREPTSHEFFATVVQILSSKFAVTLCQDGQLRLSAIRGSLWKLYPLKIGDVVLIGIREYQDYVADIFYRYNAEEVAQLSILSHFQQMSSLVPKETQTKKIDAVKKYVKTASQEIEPDEPIIPSLAKLCIKKVASHFLWLLPEIKKLSVDIQDELLHNTIQNTPHFITDSSVLPFLLSYREHLILPNCKAITNNSLLMLARNCKNMRNLDISSIFKVTDTGIKSVAQCKNLMILNISNCGRLSDKSLAAIGKSCKMLVSLNISKSVQFRQPGLEAIGKGCKNLRYLDITECPNIIQNYSVLTHFSLLESFAYSKTEKTHISAEVCQNITKYLTSLIELDLSGWKVYYLEHFNELEELEKLLLLKRLVLKVDMSDVPEQFLLKFAHVLYFANKEE